MRMRALVMPAIAAAVAAALCGCGGEKQTGKLRVFVTIPPLEYFVDRIGGAHVETGVLVAPGQSPHTFEPTPRQIAELSDSKLYFSIGMPFEEALLDRVKSIAPDIRLVDMRRGITLRTMTGDEVGADAQGGRGKGEAAGEHAGEPDPHYWLSPGNARIMAATVAHGLETADPASAADYRANLAALDADLAAVDARLKAALAPLAGQEIIVFHPAFGYFAQAYGLRQAAVEVEGREPSAKQMAQLVEQAEKSGAKVIFVQPQFSARSAGAVAKAIGGAVVPMDDLAYDYIANLELMARKVEAALARLPQGAAPPGGGER